MRIQMKLKNNSGMIQVYVLTVLAVFLVTGLALMEMQGGSLNDYYDMRGNSQSRFLASSALQEGKYYVKQIDAAFSGTSPEQVVTVDGKNIGTYEYAVAKAGDIYTITGTGYVPNKSASKKISHTLSTQFTYDYLGVGLVALHTTADESLWMVGNAKITVLGGRVVVNSSSATGTSLAENAVLTAPELDLVGGRTGNGINATIKQIAAPIPDPLANLAVPDPAALGLVTRSASAMTITQSTTLDPGVYVGGIHCSAKVTLTLNPGIYYMDGGGFQVSGQANLSGSEVMIYNKPSGNSDSVQLVGQGTLSLTAPSSGTYQDVAIFQERSSTVEPTLGGQGILTVGGDVYFRDATVNLVGNSKGATVGSLQVASQFKISGNGTVTVNAQTE